MKKIIFLLTISCLAFTSCSKSNSDPITLVKLGDDIVAHNKYAERFIECPGDNYVEAKGQMEFSRCEPINLNWKVNSGYESSKYIIKVSENENMSDPWVYECSTTTYNFINYKINTRYYWTVETDKYVTEPSTFKTKDTTVRMMHIDGVTNFRDLGGYTTESGKKVKQGLLYRTGRFNLSSTNDPTKEITSAGEDQLMNYLNMKTELDLRYTNYESGGLNGESIVDGLEYIRIGMTANQNIAVTNKTQIRTIFEDILSDEKNYPLCFHCNIGTDRTGCLAYIILTMLGVSKTDAMCDYLLSNYAKIGDSRKFASLPYPEMFEEEEGDTLSEKVTNYLTNSCDISLDTINKIKGMLIEE